MKKTKLTKVLNVSYWILLSIIITIAGLAALSAFGFPKSYRLFVVQSGSMEPTIRTGSLAIVRPESQFKKGDIITFKVKQEADIKNPNLLISHRIVDIKNGNSGTSFITKGDANKTPDMELRPAGNVLDKVIFSIPYLGFPVGFAKTQNGFILLIVIPATIIIYSELMNIKNEAIRLIKARKKRDEEIIQVEDDFSRVFKEL